MRRQPDCVVVVSESRVWLIGRAGVSEERKKRSRIDVERVKGMPVELGGKGCGRRVGPRGSKWDRQKKARSRGELHAPSLVAWLTGINTRKNAKRDGLIELGKGFSKPRRNGTS